MRMRTILACCTLFFWCQVAAAQIDALQIRGPREVHPGQLVRLEASLQPNESPFWIVLTPVDLDYEQTDGGKRLIFAVGCEPSETITLLLLAQQVDDGRIVTRQIRRTLKVTDPSNPGDEQPEPDQQPDWSRSPLYQPVLTARNAISSEAARGQADLVANNFEMVADLCQSGSISERAKIWSLLSESNQKVLGDQSNEWEPVGVAMQAGFQKLNLAQVKDHVFHLRAIAVALRSPTHE